MMYIKNKISRKIAAWAVALPVWALIMYMLYVLVMYSGFGMLVAVVLLVLIERVVTGYDKKLKRDQYEERRS